MESDIAEVMTGLIGLAYLFGLQAMMGGGEVDEGRIARGIAQVSVVFSRIAADVTYESLAYDERTGEFTVQGLRIGIPETYGINGCEITAVRYIVSPLGREDVFSYTESAEGVEIAPACMGEQGDVALALLGPDATKIDRYSSTGSYEIGSSTFRTSTLLDTAAAGAINIAATIEGVHMAIDPIFGEPSPRGRITDAEITLQDTDALRELLPVLMGDGPDPVTMATGAMEQILSEDGISGEERALIDSAEAELTRVIEQGGPLTVRMRPGTEVSFAALGATGGPEDLLALMNPRFSRSILPEENNVPAALLKAALDAPGDMSAEDRMTVARAAASGEGLPRAPQLALGLLEPLAAEGDPEASLMRARLLHQQGDAEAAYAAALSAATAGAQGAGSLLDRIERELSVEAVLAIQGEAAGEVEAPADVAALRTMAFDMANGDGMARDYEGALRMALLASAAGDRSAGFLVERLRRRYAEAEEEDAGAWDALVSRASDEALQIWAAGLGDRIAGNE